MSKKILIIMGNPDPDTFSGVLADTYQREAENSEYEVKRVNISDLDFDPILYKGYREIQPLEHDLVDLQEAVTWADHIVVIYPNWWSTMPALLKGLFDRMWLPGFAFNFDHETKKLIKHLKGKTARVIVVTGTYSPIKTWWKYGDFTNEIQHGIFGFAGIKTNVTVFGPCNKVNDKIKDGWLKKVEVFGKKGC